MDLNNQLVGSQQDSLDRKTPMEVEVAIEDTTVKEVPSTTFVKPDETRNLSCMQSAIPNFNAISNVDKVVINSQSKDTWKLQTPQPIRASKHADESYSQQNANSDKMLLKCSFTRSCSAFASTDKTDSNKNSFKKLMDDMNNFKRCNSAPLLEADDSAVPMSPINLANQPRTNRSRCMSASVSSPKSALPVPVKSRLINQLIKEESLEGIQNKEKEHEREVQVNFQISSNWRGFSLTDGDKPDTNEIQMKISNINQHSRSSPLTGPHKNQSSYLPATRPCKAIDFSNLSSSVPSPLTLLHSPTSPTRPTSACSIVPGIIGRQIYSPIVRNSSRSPSPSPTRKHFVTRRRSQSPVVKPSTLGNTLKRKYDSDNEYCLSPKRLNVNTTTTSAPETTSTRNSFTHIRIKQFQKPSSLLNPTPMLVDNNSAHPATTSAIPCSSVHNTSNSVFHRVIQTPSFGNLLNGLNFNSERCSSPASSTCSSSSLEGLKDLQPFAHHPYMSYNSPKKNFKQVGDND